MTQIEPRGRGTGILKTVLYGLAGLLLAIGLVVSISLLLSADYMIGNLLLPVQLMGNSAIADLLKGLLRGVVINTGIVLLALSLALSTLLFALGRLVGRVAELEERLEKLERKDQAAGLETRPTSIEISMEKLDEIPHHHDLG